MSLLGSAINALVVGIVGLVLAWLGKGQFDAIKARLEAQFEAVDQRFEAIDRRFEAMDARIDRLEVRMDRFQASLDGMRSDLTQVALAVGARPRAADR